MHGCRVGQGAGSGIADGKCWRLWVQTRLGAGGEGRSAGLLCSFSLISVLLLLCTWGCALQHKCSACPSCHLPLVLQLSTGIPCSQVCSSWIRTNAVSKNPFAVGSLPIAFGRIFSRNLNISLTCFCSVLISGASRWLCSVGAELLQKHLTKAVAWLPVPCSTGASPPPCPAFPHSEEWILCLQTLLDEKYILKN